MRNDDTPSASDRPATPEDTPQGLAFAVGAYGLWGFLPLYVKAMAHIPASEIVVHRIIWSGPCGGAGADPAGAHGNAA
jgi:chloramphenicol-sensitive protein RarD